MNHPSPNTTKADQVSSEPNDVIEVELVIPSRPHISVQHSASHAAICTWAQDERMERVEYQHVEIPLDDVPAVIVALKIIVDKVRG